MKRTIFIIVVIFIISGISFSQEEIQDLTKIQEPEDYVMKVQGLDPELLEIYQSKSTGLYLSFGVLIFGLILVCLAIFMTLKRPEGWCTHSTRIIGLILVIVAGLFLITAGYSQNQIAPMIGLLGTVAGYLLGKSDQERTHNNLKK